MLSAVSKRVNLTMSPLCTTRVTLGAADVDALVTRIFTFEPRANGVFTVAEITPCADTRELTTFVPLATFSSATPVAGVVAALFDAVGVSADAVTVPHGRSRYMV